MKKKTFAQLRPGDVVTQFASGPLEVDRIERTEGWSHGGSGATWVEKVVVSDTTGCTVAREPGFRVSVR